MIRCWAPRRREDPSHFPDDYEDDLDIVIGGRVVDELKNGPRHERLARLVDKGVRMPGEPYRRGEA